MDIPIKLEPNSGINCVVCLKTDVHIFGENEIKTEIMIVYKELLKDHLIHLDGITIEMCFECMDTLNGINDLRRKCVSSIQILSRQAKTVDDKILEDIDNLDFLPPLIKLEEELFVSDLTIQVDETPKKTKRVQKNSNKKQKMNNPAQKEPQTLNRKAGYCYVCCTTSRSVLKHVLDVHSREFEGKVRCLLCNEACNDAQGVLDHQKSEHMEFDETKQCGKCEMKTKSREEYVKHVHLTHYKERKTVLPCDYCDSVYLEMPSYKYHLWTHLGALKCKYCDKSFYDQVACAEHIKEHEKRFVNFSCHFCGYISRHKPLLIKHLFMYHVDPLNIKCNLCDKVYKTKIQLSSHVQRVHTEKKIQCTQCGLKFSNVSSLSKHIVLKHTENAAKPWRRKERPQTRNFACDQCDMKFFVASTLKKHKFTHSKTRPYQCHMCSTGYYMNDYLRKHYLREHEIIYSAKEIRKMCGFKRYDDSD